MSGGLGQRNCGKSVNLPGFGRCWCRSEVKQKLEAQSEL